MRAKEFITEAILDINDDVDMLYDYFFKDLVADVLAGTWDGEIHMSKTDTDQLECPICQKASAKNFCTIYINKEGYGNFYQPDQNLISLSMNLGALNLFKWYKQEAVNMTGNQGNRLRHELSPAVIKGSIHHELSHWIRDSLHKSISPLINQAKETGRTTVLPSGKEINAHAIERDSQVHNFVQMKREYSDVWDQLTFGQAIANSGPLHNIFSNMPAAEKPQWIRQLRSRLAREGLLGKNMTGAVNL